MVGAILPMEALMGRGETASTLGPGIGLLISGVANFFLGRWLNLTRPAQEVEKLRNQLRAEMWERVANGAFQMSPGAPAPSSEEEAAAQIEQVVENQVRDMERARRNIHTLFFIPIHWIGLIEGVSGLVSVLYSPFAG